MAKILIPTPLRPYTDKQDAVDASGATVGELLADLTRRHSGLKAHLYNEQGKLRSFVNVYVNDEDIRYLQKEQTPVAASDTVSIIPSVAGGVPTTTDADANLGSIRLQPDREPPTLSNDEVKRYSRHLIMPEVGVDGQRKLKAARVLCIGAGGLGSPVAMYLAAAGVGTIGLVDFDVVDYSNLQRQILHSTPDVGKPKLQSAKEKLEALNPEIDIRTHEVALSSQNALQLFEPYDVIFRFEGQASVFAIKDGPCYRCLYPEPPPPGLVPSCAEGGVLGVLPGLIGVIQATETVKLIMGIGEPLIGRFLIYDALRMRFRELKLRKDPDCPVCGTHPTIHKLIDYEEFCGLRGQEQPVNTIPAGVPEITVEELKQQLDAKKDLFILDVREPHEYKICNLNGYLIPLNDLPKRFQELDPNKELVVHCRSGARSAKAVTFLQQAGFTKAKNLKGGILAWADRIDPKVPKY